MRSIPKKLLEEMLASVFYQKCIREKTGECEGRITLEHAIIYAGKQVNEKWAIDPVCAYHHCVDQYQDCGDIDKRFHEWVSLTRLFNSSETYQREQKQKYSRAWADWQQKLIYLNKIYEGKRYPTDIQEEE